MHATSHPSAKPAATVIIPVRPATDPNHVPGTATRGLLRRTLGVGHPSRRTLGVGHPSRRTLGRTLPSRRTLGRSEP
jgi:hypothetical protein